MKASAATPSSARSPAELRLEAGTTVALFRWTGDRWSHRILVAGAAAPTDWDSLEGPWPPGTDPCWPASPVLVELSRVELPRDGGTAVAGVGLAGRSHFSASFAPDPDAADTIRIEIACRLHAAPAWLGSTYRRGGGLVRLAATAPAAPLPATVVWSYAIGPTGLVALRGAKAAESAAPEGRHSG